MGNRKSEKANSEGGSDGCNGSGSGCKLVVMVVVEVYQTKTSTLGKNMCTHTQNMDTPQAVPSKVLMRAPVVVFHSVRHGFQEVIKILVARLSLTCLPVSGLDEPRNLPRTPSAYYTPRWGVRGVVLRWYVHRTKQQVAGEDQSRNLTDFVPDARSRRPTFSAGP